MSTPDTTDTPRWKRTETMGKRLQLVADIARLEARCINAGMYKTAMEIRDKLLPLAILDAADSEEGL